MARSININVSAVSTSLYYGENKLYVCDIHENGGIEVHDLVSGQCIKLVRNNTNACGTAHAVTVTGSLTVITDSQSRQVKQISQDGTVTVLAGNGDNSRKFGPGISCSFSQLTFLCKEGMSLFVVDSGNTTLSLVSSPCGMMTYLQNLGNLYDAFVIHTKQKASLEEAIVLTTNSIEYFEGTVAEVQADNMHVSSHTNPQGPQGRCTSASIFDMKTFQRLLSDLKEEYPDFLENCHHQSE